MSFGIGGEITINEDFTIESIFGDKKIQLKAGDKGFIDSNKNVHYTTGAARGKIQKLSDLTDEKVEGYDHENMSKVIFKWLNNRFNLDEYFEDYDIDKKYFIEEIECALSEIL